ncbi:MAG: response regulator [Chloroflexi bacterium]|nr:response regulator [Chloroflexota bacterium]
MRDKRIKVLLIEDDNGDAQLLREMLAKAGDNFEFERADCLSGGLDHLAAGDIAVILLDLNLPDSQGLSTVTQLRTRVLYVPIIALIAPGDEMTVVKVNPHHRARTSFEKRACLRFQRSQLHCSRRV